jgi:hypothetical protein
MLSDVAQSRRWNKYWTSIELTSAQTHGTGTTFRTKTDDGDTFDFRICDWDAPQRIAFCPIRDPSERYGITLDSHVFQVKAISDEECEVTITAHASAHGLRGRIVALFFWAGHQREGLNAALDSIQSVFQPDLFKDEPAGQTTQEALPE